MCGTEVTNAIANLAELRDPSFGAVERPIQHRLQIGAYWLAPVLKVDGRAHRPNPTRRIHAEP